MLEGEPVTIRGKTVPIADTMQGRLISSEEGRATLRYPVLKEFMNPSGTLQGGAFGVMMDTAMAVASTGLTTVTMQTTILRPISEGFVTVTADIVREGRRIIYAEGKVHDEQGLLLATGNQTAVPLNRGELNKD